MCVGFDLCKITNTSDWNENGVKICLVITETSRNHIWQTAVTASINIMVIINHNACSFSRETSSRITTPLSHFIYFFKWVIAPKGSTLTHLQLCRIIFHFKLKAEQTWSSIYHETLGVFPVAGLSLLSTSVLNCLTCTTESKATMHLMWPCVLCKWWCFNEETMNNSEVVFHEQCTTGFKFIETELLWKNIKWRWTVSLPAWCPGLLIINIFQHAENNPFNQFVKLRKCTPLVSTPTYLLATACLS